MTVGILIAAILALSFILYKSSDYLVKAIHDLSGRTIFSVFFLASIFTGVATSIPELFVGIISAVEKNSEFGFGNAIGSNIANIALIMPIAILVSGMVLNIRKAHFSRQTILILLSASLFPFLLGADGIISRFDGFFLLFLFFVYAVYIFNKRPTGVYGFRNVLSRIVMSFEDKNILKATIIAVGSTILMICAAHFLLKSSLLLAQLLGIQPFLVALFIVAPGTSLPELFVAMVAIRRKEIDVLYGDIYGSLVANANLVVGLTALIRPIRISIFSHYSLSIAALIITFSLFFIFSFTKRRFEKWEAVVLLGIYILFFLAETYI
ncbi:MAG: sodium:calcium antiporter [Candidatus Roizmanbacteria bacterium]|nr:sodium:calcium antiporter [Candidatus Roizmanbacteria bacterium]